MWPLTIALTLAYAVVGYLVVPVIAALVQPLVRRLNATVTGPPADELSPEDRARRMEAGLRFFALAVTLALVWVLAWSVVTRFDVYRWPIWLVGAALSLWFYRAIVLRRDVHERL
jgi:hypothetical protein